MAKKKAGKGKTEPAGERIVCRNRKARFHYEIFDSVEVGIVLTGTEVKSLRAGTASLEESFARCETGEVWLYNCEIPVYKHASVMNHEPKRKRKLLLHRRQIEKFAKGAAERGFTLIPIRLYFHRGRAKIELAIARGKKTFDKRESLKERAARQEIQGVRGRRRPPR